MKNIDAMWSTFMILSVVAAISIYNIPNDDTGALILLSSFVGLFLILVLGIIISEDNNFFK